MSIVESFEFVEIVNALPVFIGVSLVKDFFVDFQQRGFLGITVVVKFIAVFEQEWFEIDHEL
jgi:hypothetical protein